MIQISAPAKVNLTLRVLGKRPDGYHALESVMQQLTLADTLTFDDAPPGEVRFTCSDPSLETEDNLVVRAARLMQAACPVPRGVAIHLTKYIPKQAGLGGGSSDAAATLAALNEFWEIRLPLDELTDLAAQLGSDVPFFLSGPCAVVRGRGESMTPVIHTTPCHVVLAKPSAGLSTPLVYSQLHAGPLTSTREQFLPETHAMLAAIKSGSVDAIAAAMVNDLEGPALTLMPGLMRLRERMLEEGCLSVLLCGSGSALCGLCADSETASHAARDLTNDFPWVWAGAWQQFR